MKILALDAATKCGWAFVDGDGNIESGRWDFSLQKGELSGTRFVRFMGKIQLIHDLVDGLDVIAYERPVSCRGNAQRVLGGLLAVTELWTSVNNVKLEMVTPTEVKSYATGNGNANKIAMTNAANRQWPEIDIMTNDQADALWILDLVRNRMNG